MDAYNINGWQRGRYENVLLAKTIKSNRFHIYQKADKYQFFITRMVNPKRGKNKWFKLLLDSENIKISFNQLEDCQTFCEFVNIEKHLIKKP